MLPAVMGTSKRKNPAAVALAKLRAESLTPEQRSEIGRMGGEARMQNTTAKERKEIGRRAGLASAKARKKKAKQRRAAEVAHAG
jgi:hypothetical protein